MQNLMLVLTFSVLDRNYPFWGNLVPSLIRNAEFNGGGHVSWTLCTNNPFRILMLSD